MTKSLLTLAYADFLRAFDLKSHDVIVDKGCMDVFMGNTQSIERLSLLLHPQAYRFVKDIMKQEANNMSDAWAFLSCTDPYMLVGEVEKITFCGIVGSATSFVNAPSKRTLH